MTESRGEVFDLGYQHYDGPREGRMRARKAIWVNGVRTALGLGRGSRAKVLPVLLFVAAMAPAVILTLVASVSGTSGDLPGHAGYYRIISTILLLFSAIIAPELLCPDRRDGVIYLYLVRPLTTTDYVTGRWLAFFSVTLALVYSGQMILLVGFTLAAAEPLDYLRNNWLDIPRFLAAGVAVALFTTTLPMAVAAFTTRRAYAAAFVIGLFIISAPTAELLTNCDPHEAAESAQQSEGSVAECDPITGDAAKWFSLINFRQAPVHVSDLIFAEENEEQAGMLLRELPAGVPIGWYLLLTAGPGVALWWRYRRMNV